MVATALVLLVSKIPTFWFSIPVAITMIREISVSALREWMAENNMRSTVKVGAIGKLKAALQMISTTLLLWAIPASSQAALPNSAYKSIIYRIGILLFYASTFFAILSAAMYFSFAYPLFLNAQPRLDSSKVKG